MSDVNNFEWPLPPFNDELEPQAQKQEWEEWLQAFELVIKVKKIESQDEKFAILLARGGRGLQRIYFNKKPVKEEITEVEFPSTVPEYDNAIKRFNDYFVGKSNPRVELEVFRSLKQGTDESFNKFLLRLRCQAKRCKFGEREEDEISHQVTMGAKTERVRDKGLEGKMKLDELTQYAVARELLDAQRSMFKDQTSGLDSQGKDVAAVRSNDIGQGAYNFKNQNRNVISYRSSRGGYTRFANRNPGNERNVCSRCGSQRHNGNDSNCPARAMECRKCNFKGHLEAQCRSKRRREASPEWQSKKRAYKENVNIVDDEWKVDLPERQEDFFSKV